MSSVRLNNIRAQVREAGIQVLWRQWSVIGASALSGEAKRARAIIDPEALLLFSLYLMPAERRLQEFIRWWATVGSDLLSVQRTKTLARRFPSATKERLGVFAREAVSAGDNRWRRYASEPRKEENGRRTGSELKGADQPRLHPSPALVLRLRAGCGVTAKADVLAYLLGLRERAATTQETADATGYARVTVRGALIDLERAGFIRSSGRGVARYRAPEAPWAQVLQFGSEDTADDREYNAPAWRYWSWLFPFLAYVDRWSSLELSAEGAYLLSSRARDLFEEYQPAFETCRIDVPRPGAYPGAAYLEAFEETVSRTTDWVADNV